MPWSRWSCGLYIILIAGHISAFQRQRLSAQLSSMRCIFCASIAFADQPICSACIEKLLAQQECLESDDDSQLPSDEDPISEDEFDDESLELVGRPGNSLEFGAPRGCPVNLESVNVNGLDAGLEEKVDDSIVEKDLPLPGPFNAK